MKQSFRLRLMAAFLRFRYRSKNLLAPAWERIEERGIIRKREEVTRTDIAVDMLPSIVQ